MFSMPKSETGPPILHQFFSNEKGELPLFIRGIDEFVHIKFVYLQGKLDTSASVEMDRFFKKAQKSPINLDRSVLLDFRKVEHVDSAGIAHLFKILTLLKKDNHRLGLINVSEEIRDLLGILKVDHAFQVFETKSEALKEVLKWSDEW